MELSDLEARLHILDIETRYALIKIAYSLWYGQKSRCYNKESNSYKYYGAKGIKVEYTKDQFAIWFLYTYSKLNIKFEKLTIGRIDHSKNYSFDNIILQEASENSKEAAIRKKHVMVLEKIHPKGLN